MKPTSLAELSASMLATQAADRGRAGPLGPPTERGSAEMASAPERSGGVSRGGCPKGAEANIGRGGPSGPALPQNRAPPRDQFGGSAILCWVIANSASGSILPRQILSPPRPFLLQPLGNPPSYRSNQTFDEPPIHHSIGPPLVPTGSDPGRLGEKPGNNQSRVSVEQLTTHSFALFHPAHLEFEDGFFIFRFSRRNPLIFSALRPFNTFDRR